MRVLVTGAGGLIGRAVTSALRERGHDAITLDWACRKRGDVDHVENLLEPIDDSGRDQLGRAMRGVEAVVHLAGRRASVAKQHELAADLLLDNLAIDVNVLRTMRACGVKRGVYASTVSVYGQRFADEMNVEFPEDFQPGVFKEDHADRFPDNSVRFSAFGKLTTERAIEAMNLQDGSNISVVRLVNTYGPHDNFGDDALVIPSLIRRLAETPRITLEGADNRRDFLYVDDAARGIVAALESPTPGTWNLGTGVGSVIFDVACAAGYALYGTQANWKVRVDDATRLSGGVPRKVVDPSKAKRELGWEATTSLAEGIRNTVAWYRAQPALKGST